MASAQELDQFQLQQRIIERLQYVNYYRLASYWNVAFTTKEPKKFRPGTYWEDVITRYMFDRKLRQLIFDALSRIEISLRTQIAHYWAKESRDDNPHRSSNNYAPAYKVGDFLRTVDSYYQENHSEEAIFYRKQYKDVRALPVWLFVEFTTFGNLQKLLTVGFKRVSKIPSTIAANLGYDDDLNFFLSGIALLKDIRNTCAHQSRVWNRRWLSKRRSIILKNSQNPAWMLKWDDNEQTWNNTPNGKTLVSQMESTAAALTFCYQIIKTIAPQSNWKSRLIDLMEDTSSAISGLHKHLGFNNSHWMEHPLWQ